MALLRLKKTADAVIHGTTAHCIAFVVYLDRKTPTAFLASGNCSQCATMLHSSLEMMPPGFRKC